MKEINIIIIVFLLLACKEQKGNKEIIKCPNTTVVTHDNFNIRFCLPEYLESYRKDSLFEGYSIGTRTDYNYSLSSNPISGNGFTRTIKYENAPFVNLCVSVDEDAITNKQLKKGEDFIKEMIGKKGHILPIELLDTSYTESEDFYNYQMEWKRNDFEYHYDNLFYVKENGNIISFSFETMNDSQKKYRIDAKKLMQSIEIKK